MLLAGLVASIPLAARAAPLAFNIPAGGLDEALRAYARITGRQILFRSEDVRDRRFGGLQGVLDPDAALAAIIKGTGLVIDRPTATVIVLRADPAPSRQDDRGGPEDRPGPDVVVTGTNIRGGETGGPVRVLKRSDLERSGKATVADLIAAQTANFGGSGNPVASLSGIDQASLNYSLTPAANLRGLGTDATLTLFDGRRVAGSGGRGDFTDLSAIPSIAVDRVEILTDGASAIYGSDAVAGVVNLILRHRFDGLDFRLRGGMSTRGDPASGLAAGAAGRPKRRAIVISNQGESARNRSSRSLSQDVASVLAGIVVSAR